MNKFIGLKACDIGILARSNNSARVIRDNISLYNTQLRDETPLDALSTPRAIFFSECLYCFFDIKSSFNSLFEIYLENSKSKRGIKKSLSALISIKKKYVSTLYLDKVEIMSELISVSELLFPKSEKLDSESGLQETLNSDIYIKSYSPMEDDCIQLMTFHMSKGLEFRIVFHLDLYQWIIPSYPAIKGNQNEMVQSVNLHYVGITRAKDACILITPSQRNDFKNKTIKNAQTSDFLLRSDLIHLRKIL